MLADSSYAASCQISLVLASTVRHYLTLSATTLEMNCLVDRRRCLLGSAAEVSATYGTTMSRAACARRTAPDRENSTDRQHRDSTIVLHRLAFVVVFTALLLATAALGCCGCRSQDAEIYVMHTWSLKILTVADVIAHRRCHSHMLRLRRALVGCATFMHNWVSNCHRISILLRWSWLYHVPGIKTMVLHNSCKINAWNHAMAAAVYLVGWWRKTILCIYVYLD